jgi:ABC-type branched-subunit amino acid transport system ATPase component
MMDRQGERRISEALVREVVSDGLIVDQADSGALHVSDHVIVVRRGQVGITTFRHPLLGEWRAERSSALATSITKNLDTAYFFNQVIYC